MRFAVITARYLSILLLISHFLQATVAGQTENYTVLSCKDKDGEILKSYFLGDYSVNDIQKNFASRWQYLEDKCQQKIKRRSPASVTQPMEYSSRVNVVSEASMRPFGVACIKDEQCESGSCHPQLGVCQARFHYPVGISY